MLKLERSLRRIASSWQNWLIILGVLGLSAINYSLAQRLPWLYLFGAIGALVFGLLALRSMSLALTLVLLTSATTGVTIATGRATPLPLGMVIMAVLVTIWLLRMVFIDHQLALKHSPLNLPFFAFLGAAVVSWIFGYVLWNWKLPAPPSNQFFVQVGQFAIYALSFATAFFTAHQILGEKDLQRWTIIICVIGIGGMVYELVTQSYILRERGLTGAVLTWAVVLVGGQLLFNPKLKRGWQLACALALLFFAIWALQNLDWKGGWVPAVLGLGFLVLLRSRKAFFGLAAYVILIVVSFWNYLWQKLVAPETSLTSGVRPLFWVDIIRMTMRSPILGLGLANYKYFWADPSFVPLSRLQYGWAVWNAWGFAPPSHNMFVDIFAQTGLLGLGLFLWGMSAVVWVLIKVYRRFSAGFMQAYSASVLCGFIAMLIGSFVFAEWLLPFVYNLTITGFSHSVYSWILLGTILGIYFSKEEKGNEARV